jgi:Acetyltransferases
MNLRDAEPDDVDDIRRVARESLDASYGDVVTEDVLLDAVDMWYGEDALAEKITDDSTFLPVALEGEEVVAFAESYVVDRRERVGEIDWLHVHPDYRGQGFGTALLTRVESMVRDAEVTRIEGQVLKTNESGTAFYEQSGYEQAGERAISIGEQEFAELLFIKQANYGEQILVEAHTDDDGTRVYVAYDESSRGSEAPFYATYTDRSHTDRYGFFCGGCRSFDAAIGTMDEVQCTNCGNRRKPARWDAAYL